MDGILLIDKPPSITSAGVVFKVKKILKEKVGHGGTLDPQATGLLLIFVGRATKLVPFFYPLEKRYIAKAKFGITTDTQDIWGNVLSSKDAGFVTKDAISKIIERFTGRIEQIPPMVSALHYQGKRLYKLAREGKIVERKKRSVFIHKIELCELTDGEQPEATFNITCSSGTYIRTLFFDMGEALKAGASLSFLRRTSIGEFSLERAITLERLKEKGKEVIIPMYDALYFMDEVITDAPERIIEGKPIRAEGKSGLARIATKDGIFVGIGKNEKGLLRPIKIIAKASDFW